MTTLKIHTLETVSEKSKVILEKSIKTNGFLPNLHGVLAESPELLEAYISIGKMFVNTSFTNEELTVVWQTINIEHKCHYCVPAHTAVATIMKVNPIITQALREEKSLPSIKLEALRDMTLLIVRNKGRVSNEQLKAFYEVGYGERQVLEIILGLSQKIISNYTNAIANTPLDEPFKQFVW